MPPIQMEKREKFSKMNAQSSKYLKFDKVPLRISEETGETLADYSVALGCPGNADATKLEIYASGVLVRKGSRFGVLTAAHCLTKPGAESQGESSKGDALLLVLQRSHRVVVPPKALVKRALATPFERQLEPDLAFLEILPGPQLRAIQAK